MFQYLIKKIYEKIYHIIDMKKNYDFDKICKQKNVFINNDNYLNRNTIFSIHPEMRKFKIDKNVGCKNFCNFLLYPKATLIINEGVFFNNYCSINCLGYIEIGSNTLFGEGVKIYDHNHKYEYLNNELKVYQFEFNIGVVKIGKNCWIGSNVTILNNVEIGDNTIIGANNCIYKSVPANFIVKAKLEYILESL